MTENAGFNFTEAEDQFGPSWHGLEEEFGRICVVIDGHEIPKTLLPLVTEDGFPPEKVSAIADLVDSPEDYWEVMGGMEEFLHGQRHFVSDYDYRRADEIVLRFHAIDKAEAAQIKEE